MQIECLHHVSITVSDLERSKTFYSEVLGLPEIVRPPFDFPGAWYALGPHQHLHLIVHPNSTFRGNKPIDGRDNHFAIRVPSYQGALAHLRSLGYREDRTPDDPLRVVVSPHAVAGFPQIYIIDPDHHVIEINAAVLD